MSTARLRAAGTEVAYGSQYEPDAALVAFSPLGMWPSGQGERFLTSRPRVQTPPCPLPAVARMATLANPPGSLGPATPAIVSSDSETDSDAEGIRITRDERCESRTGFESRHARSVSERLAFDRRHPVVYQPGFARAFDFVGLEEPFDIPVRLIVIVVIIFGTMSQ